VSVLLGLSGCPQEGPLAAQSRSACIGWLSSVDNIDEALGIASRRGCHPLRGVATYQDVYKLTYIRGPSGILVMLAEELKKS
jgi:hypothetical protein